MRSKTRQKRLLELLGAAHFDNAGVVSVAQSPAEMAHADKELGGLEVEPRAAPV